MYEKFIRTCRNIGGALSAIGFGLFSIIGDLIVLIGTGICWCGCGVNKLAMYLLHMADVAFDKSYPAEEEPATEEELDDRFSNLEVVEG